jgi:predicted outer membrane protein
MKFLTAIWLLVALSTATIFAQELTREQSTSRKSEDDQSSSTEQEGSDEPDDENLDAIIAACLFLGNQEEIALATFAQKHAQHENVKMFAKTLADEHTKALAMIQKVTPEVANLKLTMQGRNESDSEAQSEDNDPGMAMLQKVKSECLSLTQQELQEHQGAEFDKAYVGQQLGAHIAMLAELRGSKSFASPELQEIISQGEKMTMAHMEKAKKIMSQIKDEHGHKSAERPTEVSKR